MTLRTPPASFNTTTFSAQHDKIEAQINKAATVLVTPRGTTPHLIGDAMPRKSTSKIPRICAQCNSEFMANKHQVKIGKARYCSSACVGITLRRDSLDRFWKYIQKGETQDDCWLWIGGKDPDGYGIFRPTLQRQWRVHRFSYELHVGAIPPGLMILHSCPGGDNPSCVNPSHLRPGTAAENAHDTAIRGRSLSGDRHPFRINPALAKRGEAHPSARFTESDVRSIRAEYAAGGISTKRLADRYKVSKPSIRALIHGKTWSHIEGAL